MRVDPHYNLNLSAAIDTSSATEQSLTSELSSGLRVSALSDDPVAASENVSLASSIARLDSFVQSSSSEQSTLQVTDSALGEVVTQVTSALSLAVSASNGTLSTSDLSAVARQISDIRDSVVSLANTSYGGSYIFSGSQGAVQPFTLNSSTSPATVTYNGDSATDSLETPDGQKIQVNVAGSSIFTASGSSLLGTLNQLVADVNSGSIAAIQSDSSALTAALDTVSLQRGTIGSSLSRLSATSSYAQTQATNLTATQSSLLSADPTTIATDLKTAEVQGQALLSVASALNQQNLFSYMKN